ncbi:integrase, catalytic region, zinc finger, CCHC-type containing protein [Tanacetum coccineum]
MVQNVQGRHNQNQRNFAWGAGAARNGGAHNRAGNPNAGQGKPIKCYNCNGLGCIAWNCTLLKRPQNSDFFKDKMPANLQASPSNASILSQKHVIDSNGVDMGNSNVIPYEQYLTINEVFVEPSCASSVLNDAYVLHDNNTYIPDDPLVTELNIYKQQVAMYEQRAKIDLTIREQKMDEQMSILIQDRNKKEENLKKELHSVKLQLNSTIKSNKIIEETVTALKHEFKQKETKFLTDFSNLKKLNDKLKNKLYSQDHSIQTVHVMLKPKKSYEQDVVTAIEVRVMKAVFENMEAEVDQNVIDKKWGEIECKNLLITNENLIANCIAQDVFYTITASALTAFRFHDLSNAYNVAMTRVIAHLNLQLKHQHLKENIENFKSKSSKDVPEFDVFFELGKRDDHIQGHKNTIRKLKAQISQLKANKSYEISTFDYKFLDSQNLHLIKTVTALQEQLEHFKAKNEKVKQHYQELFNSIKITRVKTIERTTSIQTEIENLNTQLKAKMPCVTSNVESPKVSVFEKYAIEVESILLSQRNNRDVHQHYLNRLRDTLDTLREIELLENVSALCPKVRNKRDKVIATTPLTRKKHVTFADPLETSRNNATNHVKHPTVQKTNVPIIHSTRVSIATKARRSQSKSNKMNDKTLPANSVPEKKVEDHHRKNKSKLSKKNRVDSSTSIRGTVFNTNSNSLCKTCKVFTAVGYHWKPTGRIFPLGAQCPLTRNTKPKLVPVKQWKPTSRLIPLGGQCPLVRPTALNRRTMPTDPQGNNTPVEYHLVVQILLWTVRFGNDHFGAIVGYGYYVIGDSVISRVYYMEGLDHNLFSVGQFCDSDLEFAFRKHTCFIRDLDGVDLIKGSHRTNLYTIYVEDMMRSSPICLLSKASNNKSWLWHRRLNHLNFSTLNNLARKDLVRGLPRLKFEKDHLCSACQLGKSKKATQKPKMVNTIMENRTLVETSQTMLIFSKAPMFLWAESIATACYTQNRSLIHTFHNKTPYEPVHDKKPDLSFLRVFSALCYLTNDSEDLGKLKAKADIGLFVGYAPNKKGYRIYNKQTRQIMETIHITFEELTSSGLVPNPTPAAPYVPPTYKELEILFQPMFDKYFEPPTVDSLVPPIPAAQVLVNPSGPSVSISVDQDAPLGNHSPSSFHFQSSLVHHGVAADHSFKVNPFALANHEPFVNVFALDPSSEESSSREILIAASNQST